MLAVWKQMCPRLLQGGAVTEGDMRVVQSAPLADVVVPLVRGHRRRAASLGHRRPPSQHPRILRPEMVMELAEHGFLAQRFLEPAQALLLVSGGEIEEVASMPGDGRESGPRLTFRLIDMGQADQPAEVGVAAQVAGDQQQLGSIDLESGADQRLDAYLAAGLQSLDRPL